MWKRLCIIVGEKVLVEVVDGEVDPGALKLDQAGRQIVRGAYWETKSL